MIDKLFLLCLLLFGSIGVSGSWLAIIPGAVVFLLLPRYIKSSH